MSVVLNHKAKRKELTLERKMAPPFTKIGRKEKGKFHIVININMN
jgi:hypothetical protein